MSEEVRRAPLSPEAVAQFEAGQVILTGTVKSYCDRLLCCLSWIYDLNYKASYRLCAEHGYLTCCLNYWRSITATPAHRKNCPDGTEFSGAKNHLKKEKASTVSGRCFFQKRK